MKRLLLALTLSTFCLATTACETTRSLDSPRPDRENPARLVCEAAPDRPVLPASYVIDWTRVVTVEQAKAEHDAYVTRMVKRNEAVAGYLTEIEGRPFVCSNNAQWWRDYWAGLPKP